jgi:hypothetical protein
MTSPSTRIARAALAAALLAAAAPAAAQTLDPDAPPPGAPRPSRTFVGINLTLAQPIGEFDRFVNEGGGISGNIVHALDRSGAVAVRAELGFLVYGHTSRRFSPFDEAPEIRARVTTDNTIFFAGVGPQLMAPRGAIRPYVNGVVGFSYFSTKSSVEGVDDREEDLFDTINQDDGTFSWGAGGGLYIPIARRSRNPVSIDIGARFHGNGEAEYLREGSIQRVGESVRIVPIRSETNMVTYHLGVSIGI